MKSRYLIARRSVEMVEKDHKPDRVIEELGGCGRFQIRLAILIHILRGVVAFSFSAMMVAALTPKWRCVDPIVQTYLNDTHNENVSLALTSMPCSVQSGTKSCRKYEFEGNFRTFVSEFGLVCDDAYIPSTVMSIQMAGVLLGNLASGQLADLFGRKIPLFFSMALLAFANFLGSFSISWAMFAVSRFLVGIGGGFFLSVQHSIVCEFTLAKWRAWIIGFPTFSICLCAFALFAWLIQDWRYLQIIPAVLGVMGLFTWWHIPESFRWHFAHNQMDKANEVLRHVARCNRKPCVQLEDILDEHVEMTATSEKRYTLLDLFKSRQLVQLTLLSAIIWFAQGFVTYGINFGIQALSGNIFLNLFLFNVTTMPTRIIDVLLQNRFGRRKAAMLCYLVIGAGALTVGIVQYIDTTYKVAITNGFAILAFVGIITAWSPVQTMTIELYPTVIRTIGFGTLSTMARVGAMLGPQFVFFDQFVPGILYFASALISAVCICVFFRLTETKDAYLDDTMGETKHRGERT